MRLRANFEGEGENKCRRSEVAYKSKGDGDVFLSRCNFFVSKKGIDAIAIFKKNQYTRRNSALANRNRRGRT